MSDLDEIVAAPEKATELPPEQLKALSMRLAACQNAILLALAAGSKVAIPATGRNLTVKEAAATLGVHPSYLYHNWKGMRCARRIGRKLLFDSVGLEKWRTRNREPAREPGEEAA